MDKPFPKLIEGTRVIPCRPDEVAEIKGGRWVTFLPDTNDEDDDRVWEFDLNSGRILKIRS